MNNKLLNIIFNKKTGAVFLVLALLITAFLSSRSREEDVPTLSPFTVKEYVSKWNNVEMGVTPLEKAESTFGKRLSSNTTNNNKVVYKYDWKTPYIPLIVGTDLNGTVEYVRVPELDTEAGSLSKFKSDNSLGNPDLEMYVEGDYREKAYVYLDEGIAIEASEFSDEVHFVRYFTPMTRSEFLRTWGADLSFEYEPEGN